MQSDPKNLRKKIDRSKRIRKDYLDDKELFLDLYTNKANAGKESRRDRRTSMQVNYIYSHIRLVSPTIFAGNPRIIVRPRQPNPELEINAKNLEGTIHYWAKELGAATEFDSMVFDSFFGLAAIEVGWDYRTQIKEEMSPVLHPETGGPLLDGMGRPMMAMQPVEKVKSDQPFIRWRDSKDILLDVDVPRRKDGRFMVVRDVVSYDYFMQMTNIPQALRDKVKPTVRPEDTAKDGELRGSRANDTQSDQEWVELEWIWCRETERRYLMTPSLQNEFLLDDEWPYDIEVEDDPFPVTIVDSICDNRYPYSYSEFRPAMEHIRELNRLRTNMAYHVKANQPKYLYAKGALTRAQAQKFASARPDELIEANNPDAIKQAPMAEFPRETLGWNQMIESDLVKLTGLIEYEGSPQSETATEASIMEGRAQVRKRERSRKIEQAVTKSLAKLGQLCQQFQNEQISVEINGPQGSAFKNLNREQIQGEFLFDIEPGIMEFKNEALRKQQDLKFAEVMGSNPHVDQRLLAKRLAKSFDYKEDEILLPVDQVKTPPPEPTLKFKPIDVSMIPSAQAQAAIVHQAMAQNHVEEAQIPPDEQLGEQNPQQGEKVNLNQGRPMGGQVPLAPVDGLANVQPASEDLPGGF